MAGVNTPGNVCNRYDRKENGCMEPTFDNNEERERQARAERRAHMRREKQLQQQRRLMMRKLLPKVAGGLGVLILIVVGGVMIHNKGEEEKAKQPKTEHVAIYSDADETTADTEKSADGSNTTEDKTSDELAAAKGEDIFSETAGTIISDAAGKTITPVYSFESTADSVTINSGEVISTNAILIDESTDTIVASKGAYERISPASMTKVLTVLVAAEHITEEDLDDTFTMTTEITDYAYVNDCSAVGFAKDEKVTVRDLFYGTVLPSGADAAVGLATYVAGSHEAFVDMMNAKLEALGLSGSAHFTNCVGLYDDNHYCTVYDMAVIMKAAMQNELCREFLSKHKYTTTATTEHPEGIEISNWFLRRIEDKEVGGEVLCAKTGYVVQSQNCAVSYGTFADETPYICVTAGSTSSWRCIYDHVEIYNRYVDSAI